MHPVLSGEPAEKLTIDKRGSKLSQIHTARESLEAAARHISPMDQQRLRGVSRAVVSAEDKMVRGSDSAGKGFRLCWPTLQ